MIEKLQTQKPQPETEQKQKLVTEAGAIIDALSCNTTREIFAIIADKPSTKSEVAKKQDTTIQNASYHLEKLKTSNLIEVIGTQYSSKGCEMDVYGQKISRIVLNNSK